MAPPPPFTKGAGPALLPSRNWAGLKEPRRFIVFCKAWRKIPRSTLTCPQGRRGRVGTLRPPGTIRDASYLFQRDQPGVVGWLSSPVHSFLCLKRKGTIFFETSKDALHHPPVQKKINKNKAPIERTVGTEGTICNCGKIRRGCLAFCMERRPFPLPPLLGFDRPSAAPLVRDAELLEN